MSLLNYDIAEMSEKKSDTNISELPLLAKVERDEKERWAWESRFGTFELIGSSPPAERCIIDHRHVGISEERQPPIRKEFCYCSEEQAASGDKLLGFGNGNTILT